MKYLILLSLVLFALTEDVKCPAEIDTSVSCTKEYLPVCGYSSEGYQQGTFENQCFACRTKNVVYYQAEPCIIATQYTTTSNDGSTTSSTVVYKCNLPKNGTVDCQQTKEQVCGLFNSNVQCIKAPCGQVYDNSCLACTSANVDSYFYGDCSNYPPETTNNQSSKENDYVKCSEPRPEMCAELYTDTCAFTSYPCYTETCQKTASSGCHACSDKTVVGYILKTCSEYAQIYTAMPGNTNDKTDDATDDGNQDTQTEKTIDYQCSESRPTSCDDNVSEVCANYKCEDSTCKKEYSNECQACLDSTTLSYQRKKCEVSYEQLLTIAFLIQLLI